MLLGEGKGIAVRQHGQCPVLTIITVFLQYANAIYFTSTKIGIHLNYGQ